MVLEETTKKLIHYQKEQHSFLDSGYFSDHNLEITDKYAINALIMPKVIARQRNNKIREENDLEKKNKNTKK